MSGYDYLQKIFEFSDEVRLIIDQYNQLHHRQRLINLLHKMMFYAEQFFIEQELKNRNNPQPVKQIAEQRQQVIERLQTFAMSINSYDSELSQMLEFLESWKQRLQQEYNLA